MTLVCFRPNLTILCGQVCGHSRYLSVNRKPPAYRATLLYFYFVTHEIVRAMLHIWVEQLAAPISIWQ